MGRYTGPKGRINRRLGTQAYENSGALRALDKRETPPGMAQRRRKPSTYGLALAEKQKIKFYYGLRERQLRRYFAKARRMQGNTGEQLLLLCERRLDNVIRRAGLTCTRPQSRQGVAHRHFQLNGVTVNKPSIWVRPGDVITIRNRPNLKKLYKSYVEQFTGTASEWLNFDDGSLSLVVASLPDVDDISLPVDVGQVVAFMSR